ncbi:MAG: N-acetylmuramoyl-L-alanine amidase [Candidatus Dormibacteraeota bacterium]|nr:N-acetylmuramoyl-L-alanine amidase [Candidatus Dormibacteraeota bacterium]
MRPTSIRHLHVLANAAVIVLAANLIASLQPAQAASSDGPPAPYVVAIDAGHGGSADNAHPEKQFDPGVTAQNGLLEKDLTLAVARNLRSRLEKDRVKVVMTRDGDDFVSINQRATVANDAKADLFVSIHFNYFTDPAVGGSLVLYPDPDSQAFATTMAKGLETKLKPIGIPGDGTMAKPDLWTHVDMPAVTVEAAYLTNPKEAELMKSPANLDAVAEAVDAGLLTQAPDISKRKADINAYEKARATGPVGILAPPTRQPIVPMVVAGAAIALVVVFRRRLRPVLLPTLAAVIAVISYSIQRLRQQPEWRTRRGVRRRRSRARPWASRVDIHV